MSENSVITSYNILYKGMNFERLGLFKLIAETYSCKEVLYPGCSVHITPSFVFPHVVYVDRRTEAKRFFDAQGEVLDFVSKNREYKRKPFVQFIYQDYSKPLPLPEGSFDLLLSFFAGMVAPACEKHLRRDGLLLTNQRNEANSNFTLKSTIRFQGGKYQFVNETDVPKKEAKKKSLRQSNRGLEYAENESYFVFEKHS